MIEYSPVPSPYAMPYPMNYHINAAKKMSSIFLIKMFLEFLARTVPISSIANPVCIKITRYVQIRTQRVSTSFLDTSNEDFIDSISNMILSSVIELLRKMFIASMNII